MPDPLPDIRYATCSRLKQLDATLKGRTEALTAEARTLIGTKDSPRATNDAEGAQVRALMADAQELNDQRKALSDRHEQIHKAKAEQEARFAALPQIDFDNPGASMFGTTTTPTPIGGKAHDSRWSVKALGEMAKADPHGRLSKSLAAGGSVLVPTSFDPTVVRQGERPTLIRQLIPSQVLTGTDRYAFLRQAVRENNAAPVAKGALKPTSRYQVERVEERARVIAHLSEPIDRVDLEDAADLAAFLDSELRYGVLTAGEDQIINGDGTGENLTGILATPGTTVQPYSTDALTTLRKALTVQQVLSNNPTAFVLSPEDWQNLELLREDGTSGGYMLSQGPVDRAAQKLWGLAVVVSSAMTTGTAILGDWAGSARIFQREDTQITWSDGVWASDGAGGGSIGFQRNQLTMRAEERVGLAVLRPSAFVEIDLTA